MRSCFLGMLRRLTIFAATFFAATSLCTAAPTAAETAEGHPVLRPTDRCANCHDIEGSAKIRKAPDHLPTQFSCDTCHSKSNLTTFAGTAMNHQGIRGNCALCHLPNTAQGLKVQGGMVILPQLGRGEHVITSQVGDKCETCHSMFNFTSFAGAKMNHQGINIVTGPCFICHEAGMEFVGNPVVTRPDAVNGVPHPPPEGGDCSGCHGSFASFAVNPGPIDFPPDHFPTTQGCSLCHNPLEPVPGRMSHAGIGGNCISCHGDQKFAGLAPGETLAVRPSDHIPQIEGAPADCDTCHFSDVFRRGTGFHIPPERMNHSGIGSCNPCHETGNSFGGVTMVVRPANHFGMADCAVCHESTQIPGGFGAVPRLPGGHMPNIGQQKCRVCHVIGFGPKSGVMDHAGISGSCNACHGVTPVTFDAGAGVTPVAQSSWSGHDLATGPCEGCHLKDSFTAGSGFKIPGYPPRHLPNPWGQPCADCHAGGITPGSGKMRHPAEAGAAGPCVTCHGAAAPLSFAGVTPTWAGQYGKHLPLPAGRLGDWTTACETCHQETGPGGFYLGAADDASGILHKHANVAPGSCNACHRNPLQIAPAGPEHISAARAGHEKGASCDKDGCHSVAGGFYNFKR